MREFEETGLRGLCVSVNLFAPGAEDALHGAASAGQADHRRPRGSPPPLRGFARLFRHRRRPSLRVLGGLPRRGHTARGADLTPVDRRPAALAWTPPPAAARRCSLILGFVAGRMGDKLASRLRRRR